MHRYTFFSICLLLGACASAPERRSAPPLTAPQKASLAEAERLYRQGAPEFPALRDELSSDPTTAYWLTRFLIWDVVRLREEARSTDDSFLATVATGEDPRLATALGQLQALAAAAVPALVGDLLRNRFTDRQELGVEILGDLGAVAVPGVESLLDESDWRLRRLAVSTLAAMPAEPARQRVLLRAARDRQFAVRAEALTALLRSGDEYLELGRRVLAQDPDDFVRRAVAVELGAHPSRDNAAALLSYLAVSLDSGDSRGAEAANASLRQISGYERSGDLSFWRAWLAQWSPQER